MLKWNEPEGFTMKKSVFLAATGLAYGVASSFGQGFVAFNSYVANNAAGALTTVLETGQLIGPAWHAQLYYALGTVSDPVENYEGSFPSPVSLAFTLVNGVTVDYDDNGDGYFQGPNVTIPGYAGGPITFEVVAFLGSTLDSAIARGRSGSFTMDSIDTDPSGPYSLFGDNGQPMPNFVVSILPEPSMLALAGLGGLVSFVMFRRKQ